MAITAAGTTSGDIIVGKPKWRPLENEGNLAFMLLLPTFVLLGLFIAYPFLRGIMLSVQNARVGVPGSFVGFDNFARLASDPIFHAVVRNTLLYTAVTRGKKLVVLVGTKKALGMAIRRVDTSQRYTTLRQRLQQS